MVDQSGSVNEIYSIFRYQFLGEPLSKREDDKPETVATRLSAYQRQTQPVLDFYRGIDPSIVKNFKGSETNVIWPMIKEFLDDKL